MLRNVLVAIAFACAAPAAAQTELRLWHEMRGAPAVELEVLAARFNASQHDYHLVLTSTFAAPHILFGEETFGARFAAHPAVRPLWQVMAESGLSLEAKMIPAVAAYFSDAHGRLLALPLNGATPVLYYNRDAFRRAKLDPARAPKTWYEMAEALGALVESGVACGYTTARPAWVLFENMSAWHNESFATLKGNTASRLAFNRHLMVRWVAVLSSWQKSGYFTYAGREDEAERRFASGECAVLTSSSASYAELKRRADFDLGVAQFPYYDDFDGAPQNTLVSGAGLWALEGKTRNEYRGIARFFAFLSRADVQAEWQRKTGALPFTLAAYELARRQGLYAASPGYEVGVRQLLGKAPTATSRGIRLAELGLIRRIIDEELESVWAGKKTPLEALDTAVARGNALLATQR